MNAPFGSGTRPACRPVKESVNRVCSGSDKGIFVSDSMTTSQSGTVERPALRAGLSITTWIFLEGIILFLAAGRWHWLRGWGLVGVRLLVMPIQVWVMSWANPVLLRERFQGHKGTESFDKGILLLLLPMTMAVVLVAGLDAGRFGWSQLNAVAILPGIALYLLGAAVIMWVTATNPYLESTIRIQEDRHQTVISTGPYRFVRHPMYAGAVVSYAGYPLILGSAWAYLPVGILVMLYILRTAMEDRMLQEKLPGYREYCRRTPYRLLPGTW